MIRYFEHAAHQADRVAWDVEATGDLKRQGHDEGLAFGYRKAARIAAIVADHIDAWYVHV